MPTPHNKGKAVQTRDGSSASPTQGLGCQRATCTLQVVCTRPGRTRVLERAPGFGHQRAALPRSAVQAWRIVSQGTKADLCRKATGDCNTRGLGRHWAACTPQVWPEDTTRAQSAAPSAPHTERALSLQEAHKATAPARGQPLGCLRAAGVRWQPAAFARRDCRSCQQATKAGPAEAPRRSSEAQGHKDKGGRGTSPAEAPRRSSEAQGHEDRRGEVQPRRQEGAAWLRGPRCQK